VTGAPFDGLNVLTDPIWSERCSPVSFVVPEFGGALRLPAVGPARK
jgi:L-ascorbate metabolism protein UlaG (beta-lactamase superfamily)